MHYTFFIEIAKLLVSYKRTKIDNNTKKTTHEQNKNFNNETEIIKKNQTEIVVLKNTIEMKN